ncbi:hypothetical protein P3S67_032588 [Capsicum chacoense]
MEREKENEGKREDGEANSSSVSSAMLREVIVNLRDFIERLKIEEDQIVLDTDRIEKLKLELTFLSACLQLCYYISDGSNAEMSCISYKVQDLVQSLFHQRGDYMLVKLKDHVVPRLLENIKSFIISHRQSESNATMTEEKLVELLHAVLVNLHYLPKVRAELILPSMTQYELLQNLFGNLRDFHGLKVNGCIELKAIEYVLPQIQLMVERVGHFCFVLLSYQIDKTDETDVEDEDETDEEDEDGLGHMFLKSSTFEVSQVNSMLVHLLLMITPVSPEVMHICCTILEASKSAEVGHFIKQLLEASPDILREHLIHLQQHMDFIHYEKLFVLLARVGALIREVSILIRNLEENSTDEENMKKISCASQDLLENIELLKEDLRHVFLKSPADSSQLCFPMSDGPLFMTLLLRNLNDLLNSNAYSVALIKEEISRVKEDLEHIRLFFGNVEQELHRDLWTRVLDVAYEAEHAINSILARDRGLLQLIFLLPETVAKIKLVKKEVQEKISKNMTYLLLVISTFVLGAQLTRKVMRKSCCRKFSMEVIGLKERVREDDIDDDVTDKLRRQLFGKRYLIVLDDLWDTATWDELTRPLYAIPSEFQKGSRVILTSRKKEVDEEEVMKVIQLSYDHLSDHLKPCFLYLASYPKDKDIYFSSLKELWTDEGLVEPTDLKSVEEVTEIYVDELISSSLVIVRGGSEQSCQIHDLVHDFCSIKSREEKLFDLTSSIVLYSSSSDLMLRRRTISFDEGIYSDDSSFFNTALNEIGMLVHLRCLRIWMDANALPPSFPNLCNLETLVVESTEPNLVLSPTIWSLAKLRYVQIQRTCSVFGSDIHKPAKLENLHYLFSSSPVRMECSAPEQIYFPRLDVLYKLEIVSACFKCRGRTHVHQFDFHFPSSLKVVHLVGFHLTSDALSRIEKSLPNLQKLKLFGANIEGEKEWKMEQVTFHNLKSLKRVCMFFFEWQVSHPFFRYSKRFIF